MTSNRSLLSLVSLLSLLVSLQLLTLPNHLSHAQTSTTLALLANVTLYYNDNITATPPAFQSQLYQSTAAIFQGSQNGVVGSALGSSVSGDLEIVRFNESFAAQYGARCMDGSAYAYYIRRSNSTTSANKWLVYLQVSAV